MIHHCFYIHWNLFWQFHFNVLVQWLSMKCSSLVLILTSHVKFQVYSRLKLTQRCSSPAGLVSNLNLLKFLSWNKQPHYLLRAVPWINAPSPLFRGARVAQWWDHLPPTNVARVHYSWRARSMPYVGWVCCWFSPLFREVFLRVLWFSPLLKN